MRREAIIAIAYNCEKEKFRSICFIKTKTIMWRKTLIFAVFAFTFLNFLKCTSPKSDYTLQDRIIGEWRNLFDDCNSKEGLSLIISEEHLETGTSNMRFRHSYFISRETSQGQMMELGLFDSMFSSNGSDYDTVFGPKDTIKANLYLADDILVLLIFKGGEISDQYQIANAYSKKIKEQRKTFTSKVSTVFVLPDGFRGYSWVAIEQPNGKAPEKDSEGRPIIEIPENGVLETKASVTPVALAKRELGFYFREDRDNKQGRIPHISDNCRQLFVSKNLTDEEIVNSGYDPDQVYVYYYRYNNPGREEINKLFEKEITGQVFWFRVDTLRNLLKPLSMIP